MLTRPPEICVLVKLREALLWATHVEPELRRQQGRAGRSRCKFRRRRGLEVVGAGRGWFGGGARIKASVSAGLDLRGGEEVGWKHALEDGGRETEEGGRENDTGRTGETDRNGWDRRRTAVCQRKRLPLRAGRGAVALLAGTRPGSAP